MTNLGVMTTVRDENFLSFKRHPIRVMPELVPPASAPFTAAKAGMAEANPAMTNKWRSLREQTSA
jgi:hypothetical protein